MIYIGATFIFILGLVLGSFLNVVIFRYNTGRGVRGRSHCLACGTTLHWYELIPVASFIVQKGKCRTCKSKLSTQYPSVEFLTGLLFLVTFLYYGDTLLSWRGIVVFALMLMAWCLLVVMLVYDLKHKIIPDGLVYTFAFLGLLRIFIEAPFMSSYVFYMSLLAGPLLFLPFFILWLISGGRWIGLGDGKLALGIGWMLGLGYGLSALFFAFWIGAVVSIILMVIMRLKSGTTQLTMKTEIPFAPYLVVGFALVYFWAVDVIGLHTMLGL